MIKIVYPLPSLTYAPKVNTFHARGETFSAE